MKWSSITPSWAVLLSTPIEKTPVVFRLSVPAIFQSGGPRIDKKGKKLTLNPSATAAVRIAIPCPAALDRTIDVTDGPYKRARVVWRWMPRRNQPRLRPDSGIGGGVPLGSRCRVSHPSAGLILAFVSPPRSFSGHLGRSHSGSSLSPTTGAQRSLVSYPLSFPREKTIVPAHDSA